ncbi:MAG: DegT/DnrJ/EryC1/StrS aminotransferase family protein [Polyangia bacterium]
MDRTDAHGARSKEPNDRKDPGPAKAPAGGARIALGRPSITDDEVAAAARVLRSGWLVHGPECRAFEEELAAACGRRYAAVVSSGTAALHLALWAFATEGGAGERGDGERGGGEGLELLVPAFTFPATANVSRFLDRPAQVRLCDVDADTFCVRDETLAAWLAARRGPALVVHQFGHPAGGAELGSGPDGAAAERLILSDAACAIGTREAMRGRAVCLSFHPRKVLTTGEGGAVLSDDEGLIEEVRARRAHGLVFSAGAEVAALPAAGLNYRLPEVSAAIGRIQLRRLPSLRARHRALAERYREQLVAAGLRVQADAPGRTWQALTLELPAGTDRPALRRALSERGIETQIASYALHRLAAWRDASVFTPAGLLTSGPGGPAALPVADRLHDRGLALPLHAELTDAEVDTVTSTLRALLGR